MFTDWDVREDYTSPRLPDHIPSAVAAAFPASTALFAAKCSVYTTAESHSNSATTAARGAAVAIRPLVLVGLAWQKAKTFLVVDHHTSPSVAPRDMEFEASDTTVRLVEQEVVGSRDVGPFLPR